MSGSSDKQEKDDRVPPGAKHADHHITPHHMQASIRITYYKENLIKSWMFLKNNY